MTGKKKTVLVVVAHADDMEFMAAGTIARFVDEFGYDVYEYILTDNAKGSFRLTAEKLVDVSAREARAAGKVLGLKEVRLEGYVDGELDQTPPHELREKIIAMIREIKADVVMSWDPFAPGEEHPDHRVAATAALEAAHFAGMPLFYPEQRHPAYSVTEAYWFAKKPQGAELFVDVTEVFEKKMQALLEHDCQMVMTIDALVREAEAAGVDVPVLKDLPEGGHQALIRMGVEQHCAAIGQHAGMKLAEQFRYEKIGMLEQVLGMEVTRCDF